MGLVKALTEDTIYHKEWTEMEKWRSTLQRYSTLFWVNLWSYGIDFF